MIERQAIEEREKDSELVLKKIDIRTIRFPSNDFESEYVNLSGVHSVISFSEPVKDFNGEFNNQFFLKVAHYKGSFGRDHYWMIGLDNEKRYNLLILEFGHLSGSLFNYSKQKLKKWEERMIETHKRALDKIEDLYWRGEELLEDFFSYLG